MPRRRLQGDPAQFRECVHAGLAAEPAVARGLHAAEGHLGLVVNRRTIDVANTGFDALRDVDAARKIAREHRRASFI